tara:strand:- start:5917 stop:6474 length:558 start_codon:yes stop_codon:yes gene_type:complete
MFIDKLFYRIFQLFSYLIFLLKWGFRLKKVGPGSYWISPCRIVFPSFISLGKNVVILNSARIEINPLNKSCKGLNIGNGVNIGHNFFCSSFSHVEIKDGALISDNVAIIDNNHNHVRGESSVKTNINSKPILIEKNVTIYRNSTILAGVIIGEGSVIAAHSLINKNVEPFSVVGGCPAKKINDIK